MVCVGDAIGMKKIFILLFILLCLCTTISFALTDGELFLSLEPDLQAVYCWGFLNGNFITIQIVTEKLYEEFPALCTILSWAQVMINANELKEGLIDFFISNPKTQMPLHDAAMMVAMCIYSKKEVIKS